MGTVAFNGHIIFCRDLEKTARFYEDVLGFEREWGDRQHINLLAPVTGTGDAKVNLFLHHGDDPSPVDLGMYDTDDVDAVVAKVRASGCSVGTEPADAPWGVREATVRDPDGNGLYISGPLRPAP